MSATNSLSTAASRSRAALPSDYRRVLEASNLPIEQAVAIADMVELAVRSDRGPPERWEHIKRWVKENPHPAGVSRVQIYAGDWAKIVAALDAAAPNRSDESVRVPREQ